ncbi:hypothetical protein C8R45DRAFT_850755 [Mycena sanguinolenta]|nr:hypothetical protein C8R45DRAFT_850755 [Mycena sanguinolenta]
MPIIGCDISSRIEPRGLTWDNGNYSCVYDCYFTCLMGILLHNSAIWATIAQEHNGYVQLWAMAMQSYPLNPEIARNLVREQLHNVDPLAFPYGQTPIAIHSLLTRITNDTSYGIAHIFCERCGYRAGPPTETFGQLQEIGSSVLEAYYPDGIGINSWYAMHLNELVQNCPSCTSLGVTHRMRRTISLNCVPSLLVLSLINSRTVLESSLNFETHSSNTCLRLAGMMYHSASDVHFTCVVVNKVSELWYHDGMITKNRTVYEGTLSSTWDMRVLQRRGRDYTAGSNSRNIPDALNFALCTATSYEIKFRSTDGACRSQYAVL